MSCVLSGGRGPGLANGGSAPFTVLTLTEHQLGTACYTGIGHPLLPVTADQRTHELCSYQQPDAQQLHYTPETHPRRWPQPAIAFAAASS
jgi:hypothetical protein